MHAHTESCETAFLDLILEPGEETHELSLSGSGVYHIKLVLSFPSAFY